MKNVLVVIAIFVIIFVGIAFWQLHDHTPGVNYTLIDTNHAFEIREYPSLLVAQTEITGDRLLAINNGFAVLGAYLRGNNHGNLKIPMMVPVTLQKSGQEWVVSFYLPDSLTELTAPKPNAAHIHIKQLPATKYIVMRFTGLGTDKQLERHLKVFEDYISVNHIQTKGEPIIAFYNPPWTLPFLRRNEIMFVLK